MKRETIIAKRLAQLNKACPDIWNNKTVLYVGAHKQQFSFNESLKQNKCLVDVLEISKKRCNEIKALGWVNNVIEGSVENVNKLVKSKYDLVMWCGGPAVLAKDKLKPVLDKLFALTKNLLVITTPWGKRSYTKKRLENLQKTEFTYDIQWTPLYQKDFINWGFKTSVIGEPDHPYAGNIVAWRDK